MGRRYRRLVLSRSAGTITLSGTAAAGQYSLDLTPEYAASPTPLTLTALDQQKLDAVGSGYFGQAVALDGNTALIGAHGTWSAYVFIRSDDGNWTLQQELAALESDGSTYFGFSVDLEGDTALIGAHYGGSAYVFTRSDGVWEQQAWLRATDAPGTGEFGKAVALEGNTALVGAQVNNSAYIFDIGSCNGSNFGSTGCQQTQKLTPSDGAGGYFSYNVALDGDTALIGSWDGQGVYVFTRPAVGGSWTERVKLTAESDNFGSAVALDGDTALIGAYLDDDGGTDSGSAYVFTGSGSSWTQQAKLTASDAAGNNRFGWAVALEGDTAVIGAYRGDGRVTDSGSAYVFTRSGTAWTQRAELTASDAAWWDQFGYSVALDGDAALIGADLNDGAGPDSGSAYITDLTALP